MIGAELGAPAQRRLRWSQACRIVPTRYPSIGLFDRVADAADFDALYALEAMTNERVRDDIGQVERVAREDRVFGPGSTPIMAAFTHVNVLGSRFSDGSYGVFYAARELDTAVAETRYHHGRFMRATKQPAMHLPMRLYHLKLDAQLHDLRLMPMGPGGVHDADDYGPARSLAGRLRVEGSAGVVYRSARRNGGTCAGLFRPRGASACLHAAQLLYAWDGEQFADVYERLA